jgi:hypothetical protein
MTPSTRIAHGCGAPRDDDRSPAQTAPSGASLDHAAFYGSTRTFERYKSTLLTDQQADHAVLNMFREGIINIQRVPEVIEQWERPTFEEFDQRNAWRLFNAATFALTGRQGCSVLIR